MFRGLRKRESIKNGPCYIASATLQVFAYLKETKKKGKKKKKKLLKGIGFLKLHKKNFSSENRVLFS